MDKPVRVTVCRSCCCGAERKHPDTDHDGQLERLRELARRSEGMVIVRTSECLDVCESSNVIVVHGNGKPIWFGAVLTDSVLDSLTEWVDTGADRTRVPGVLEPHRITPAPPRPRVPKP